MLAAELTLQRHGAILRELVWVEKYRGWSIQGVLDIQHILVLKTFIIKVEIPASQNQNFRSHPQFWLGEDAALIVPAASFVGAAIFRVVIELGQTLAEAIADRTLLQERHGQLVLLLHKSLQ